MRTDLRALFLLPALLLAAASAQATIRTAPVRVHIHEAPRAAVAGQPYAATFTLRIAKDGELAGVRLHGPGWQVQLADVPAGRHAVGDVVELPFIATPADPARPLTLEGTLDGQPWSREVELSTAAAEEARTGLAIADISPKDAANSWLPPEAIERMTPPGSGRWDDFLAQVGTGAAGPDGGKDAAATLTVNGRIAYTHATTHELVGSMRSAVGVWSSSYDGSLFGSSFRLHGVIETNDNGHYSLAIDWPPPGTQPRLWITFSAVNPAARLEHTDVWEDTWQWQGPVAENVAAGTYNFGTLMPRKESHQGAFHIANTILRGKQLHEGYGYGTNRVDVQWPESGSGSWYNREYNEMHMTGGASFQESTILHEYGHYWMDMYAYQPGIDYCNEICDDVIDYWFDDCGHCLWCEENEAIAWSEGFADFFSQAMTDYMAATFSIPDRDSIVSYDFQDIRVSSKCGSVLQPPLRTEGYFAAALYDLIDTADTGETSGSYPGGQDQLGGLLGEVLHVATSPMPGSPSGSRPSSSSTYLTAFRDHYPNLREDFWETIMISGFDLDTTPPSTPSGLSAINHAVGVPSPDNTISVTWDLGVDDFSGIGGYSYLFSTSLAVVDNVRDIGPSRSAVSGELAPGTWYFSLRVCDRAGNWNPGQVNLGPFTIRTAEPANLAHEQPAGWQYPLVPRNDATATLGSASVSSSLTGDAVATYWSFAGRNVGESPLPLAPIVGLTVDGEPYSTSSFSQLGAGSWSYRLNKGPLIIRGGRHTLGMFLDAGEDVAETTEIDNHWAYQWVWTPANLTSGNPVYRTTPPPERNGGFEYIHGGSIDYYNCDGFKTQATIPVQAVWMWGEGTQTDYDLRLYGPTANPTAGFQTVQRTSAREYGCTDAILIHGLNDGLSNHTLGVQNFSSSDRNYYVGKIEGAYLTPPTNDAVTLQDDHMMYLRTINLPSGSPTDISFVLRTQPGSQPLYLAFYPHTFTTVALSDAAQTVMAWNGGTARLDVNVPVGQFAAVAVYRDPINGHGPVTFALESLSTRPDLVAVTPAGWHGSLVPQPNNSIAYPFTTVPAPATLTGSSNTTYLYMSEANQSIIAAPGYRYEVYLDGSLLTWFDRQGLAPGEQQKFRGYDPYTIVGGRHTLFATLDAFGVVLEMSERNNIFGEQWMWTGPAMSLGVSVGYTAPAQRMAGFYNVTTGLAYYNCLGLHSPAFSAANGNWAGVYVVGDPGLDVDLRLHERYTTMSDGFTAVAQSSTWVGSECDFVIANFNQRPHQAYDIGVVKDSGSGDLNVVAVGTRSGTLGVGNSGPFRMTNGPGLGLHNVALPAGWYRCTLQVVAGGPADLGFSLYGPAEDLYAKDGALPDAMAWQAGPTDPESFVVRVPETGNYCLAVWAVGRQDARASVVDYTLSIDTTTDVLDELPAPLRTRLVAAAPNPFNPTTTINYELAAPGVAVLEIFNPRGQRVRELVRATMPAGRHAVVWDGRDSRGSTVASGVYYARLTAGEQKGLLKMTLLK